MIPEDTKTSIKWLETVDSTNSELRRNIDSSDNLSVIAAECQNAGRGQGDHTWFASPGKNLTFSILYRFPAGSSFTLKASQARTITEITTLAIRDYLGKKGINARIKWPNDIWIENRKICGILIENTLDKDRIATSIVGIGLNVNETGWPESLPNPVSMKDLTGEEYSVRDELAALHKEICRRYAQIATPDGRLSLQEEFEKYMFRLREELK